MTREEHLLIILAEECNEVAQRAAKALRFKLTDPDGKEPNQPYTNKDRLILEINDLLAVIEMVFGEQDIVSQMLKDDKKKKVEKYLELSKKLGTLDAK
jgi:NTP pyrophosphatase (non-canonical NTP hydrolase)